MADRTGSSGNDFLIFNGTFQSVSFQVTNPYSGQTLTFSGQYNVSSISYDGLNGFDILLMTNLADALFIRDPDSGEQDLISMEAVLCGDGADIIHLADLDYSLEDITLEGGSSDDVLWANVGNDFLSGSRGNDILDGGPGKDSLNGGPDADFLNGGDGDDKFIFSTDSAFGLAGTVTTTNLGSPDSPGTNEQLVLDGKNLSLDVYDGDAGFDTLILTSSDDAILLEDSLHQGHDLAGAQRIFEIEEILGGAGSDVINLTSTTISYGDVSLHGEDGNDVLWSNAGNDFLNGGSHNDSLWSSSGNDLLIGGAGNDRVGGGLGNDEVSGSEGNDILIDNGVVIGGSAASGPGKGLGHLKAKGRGHEKHDGDGTPGHAKHHDSQVVLADDDDTYTGGMGSDLFVFPPNNGHDTISDLLPGAGTDDVIDISAWGISSFASLTAIMDDGDGTSDTLIAFNENSTITLMGVQVWQLHADDFIFA